MTFTNPFWLFLLFLLPLLAYAYRNQLHGAVKKVSSVMIYKKLTRKVVVKKKIKLPLRFFLELTALGLLVLALTEYKESSFALRAMEDKGTKVGESAKKADSSQVARSAEADILVVSPLTKNELGLNKVKNFNFEVVSAKTAQDMSKERLSRHRLLIFHRSAPPSAEKIPTLLVLPPEDNPVFPLVTGHDGEALNVKLPKVTSFDSSHPIVSYLRLGLLAPPSSLIFNPPKWAEAVIGTERGAMLVAGVSSGVRFAGVGFEIFPFDGVNTPLESILLFNLIDWLENKDEAAENSVNVQKDTVGNLLTADLSSVASIFAEATTDKLAKVDTNKDSMPKTGISWQVLAILAIIILAIDLGLRVRF